MNNKESVNVNLLQPHRVKLLDVKAYKRRWIILVLFMVYSAINAFQWLEYSIITNIVMKYYNVSTVAVDWTSVIYMALYAPLVLPASYIIDKKGLRIAALIGGLGTALGTTIKVLSIDQNLFYVVLIGQGILSASQLMIICLPPRIAAVWFKANEVSTSCSLGVFGTQFGCAMGFLLPPILVKNHVNPNDIAADLKVLCWTPTALIIPVAFVLILYFPFQPPKPPNITQVEERKNQEKYTYTKFFSSLKILLRNIPFVIHIVAYGINVAVFCAVSTLLNQFVLQYFPNAEEDAGRMGLVMIVSGMIGSIIFGIFLDKTHKYKETSFGIYLFSSFSVVVFMFALEVKSKFLAYISMAIVGLFTNAYVSVGFEFAMELTHPSPESTTSGLLMAPSQILGVMFTLMLGKLNSVVGPFWALSSQAALLGVGAIITSFIPNKLKRQDAFNKGKNNFGNL